MYGKLIRNIKQEGMWATGRSIKKNLEKRLLKGLSDGCDCSWPVIYQMD